MNPGWSLAPLNQITAKGSRAWGICQKEVTVLKLLETHRHEASTQQILCLLQIYINRVSREDHACNRFSYGHTSRCQQSENVLGQNKIMLA